MDTINSITELHSLLASMRPFEDADFLHQIRSFYRVENTWSSNAIEGNSYTLSETKVLLEDGLTAGGKPLSDAYTIVGHAKAYDYMFSLVASNSLTENDIRFFHTLLMKKLDNASIPGEYRRIPVFISGSKYPVCAHMDIPNQMARLIEQQKEFFGNFHPVIAAAKFHKELDFIHPFSDGNGRVSRLCMNALLLQRGYLPVSIPPILRHDYISILEEAHRNDQKFVNFIVQQEHEILKDFMSMAGQELDFHQNNFSPS